MPYAVWCLKCIENTFCSIDDLMTLIFEQQKWNKHVSYHLESCHWILFVCMHVHGKLVNYTMYEEKYGFCNIFPNWMSFKIGFVLKIMCFNQNGPSIFLVLFNLQKPRDFISIQIERKRINTFDIQFVNGNGVFVVSWIWELNIRQSKHELVWPNAHCPLLIAHIPTYSPTRSFIKS